MTPPRSSVRGLAFCHGFTVATGDASVGAVETPLFTGAASSPDYLIIRTTDVIPGSFRAVPATLVEEVDPARRLITLCVDRDTIAALPEHLPLER